MKIHVISSSFSTEYSGSIFKVQCVGDSNSLNGLLPTTGSVLISEMQFGNGIIPESDFTPTSTIGPIYLNVGETIEAPIGRMKVGANPSPSSTNGLLIYRYV
jgi:hypothetical protein|tara:strand:- start:165 stop:470 length:306 start_codon:yes stop_codon:yes gene_type:complete